MADQTHEEMTRQPGGLPGVIHLDLPGALRRRRSVLRRACWPIARIIMISLAVIALIGGAGFLWLSAGPVQIAWLGPRVAATLNDRVGGVAHFEIGPTSIETSGNRLAIATEQLKIVNAAGRTILAAPRAEIRLDALALLTGEVRPTRLELYDLDIRLAVLASGALALSAGDEPLRLWDVVPQSDATAIAPAGHAAIGAVAAAALSQLVDQIVKEEGALGGLRKIGVSHGRLAFTDETTHDSVTFDGLELSFERLPAGAVLRVAANGPSRRWSLDATATATPGSRKALSVNANNLSIEELGLLTGVRDPGFDFDMPLGGSLRLGVSEDGRIAAFGGRLTVGAGFLHLNDPDHEPIQVEAVEADFRQNDATGLIDIEPASLVTSNMRFAFAGAITPPRDGQEHWSLHFESRKGSAFTAERPGETPIVVETGRIEARYEPATRTLALESLDVAGPELALKATAEFLFEEPAPRIAAQVNVGRMPVRNVLRLWPTALAPPVRAWLLEHLLAGTLEKGSMAISLSAPDFEIMRAHKALPATSFTTDYALSGAQLTYLPGAPPIIGIDGNGQIAGRTVTFTGTRGTLDLRGGRKLALADGVFTVPDTDQRPIQAAFNVRIAGSLDSLADALAYPAFKSFGFVPFDAAAVKGQVDGRLGIDFKFLPKGAKPEDIASVHATGTISNFVVEKLLGKERFDQGTLTVALDRSGVKASGQGRLFGQPAGLDVRPNSDGEMEAAITATLDDATRARLGYGTGPGLTGPIGARFTSVIGDDSDGKADVELDFTKAAIDGLVPGFSKPAGRPAKANFTISTASDKAVVQDLVVEAGPSSARGSLQFDAAGAIQQARLSQVKLSPGDDMKLDADFGKDGVRLVIRGNAVDARPFLRALSVAEPGASRDPVASRDIDLDVRSALVSGNNREVISNVELRLVRKGGVVRQFSLGGKLGRDALTGQMMRARDTGPADVTITTANAGSLLSFVDFYRRMEGGRLSVIMQVSEKSTAGQMTIHDFVVRDEPGLKRIVSEGIQSKDTRTGAIRIDTSAVRFSKLSLDFARTGARIDLRNGAMFGVNIGMTVEGWLDFARDRVNFNGTFVPAYGLNNLFSQIPVVGLILGGGTHEGLFGINYRVSGPASAPVLSINPLSAIAPGIFRKVLGAADYGAVPPGQGVPQGGDAGAPAAPLR